jgi:putative two-component system response regulator
MLVVGVVMAVLWVSYPWMIAFASAGLAALYHAFRSTVLLERQTLDTLFELTDTLEARDPYTHGHSQRVGQYAEQLAFALALDEEKSHIVFLAGRLHDIGKCAVRNEVLLKPGPLDADEREHMCIHPEVGGQMLARLSMFSECSEMVRAHHERWDGRGYPDKLAGTAIPFGARVIAVVDSYDAMTTNRPYRNSLGHAEAVKRLSEGAGAQWDPEVVEVFLSLLEQGRVRPVSALSSAPTPLPNFTAATLA